MNGHDTSGEAINFLFWSICWTKKRVCASVFSFFLLTRGWGRLETRPTVAMCVVLFKVAPRPRDFGRVLQSVCIIDRYQSKSISKLLECERSSGVWHTHIDTPTLSSWRTHTMIFQCQMNTLARVPLTLHDSILSRWICSVYSLDELLVRVTIRRSNGYAIWLGLVTSRTTRHPAQWRPCRCPRTKWGTSWTWIHPCNRRAEFYHLRRSPYFTRSSRSVSASDHTESTWKDHVQIHQGILPVEFHAKWQVIYCCLHSVLHDLHVNRSASQKQYLFLHTHWLACCGHTWFWVSRKHTRGYAKAMLQHSETLCDTL